MQPVLVVLLVALPGNKVTANFRCTCTLADIYHGSMFYSTVDVGTNSHSSLIISEYPPGYYSNHLLKRKKETFKLMCTFFQAMFIRCVRSLLLILVVYDYPSKEAS